MNVVIASKPTLLSAKPRFGTQTAPITLVNAGPALTSGATGRRGATSNRVTRRDQRRCDRDRREAVGGV